MFRRFTAAVFLASMAVAVAGPMDIEFARESRWILVPGHSEYILDQCSRNTPKGITSYWQPSSTDIDTLEQKLLFYLSESKKPPNRRYTGIYVGILTHGNKLIYANYSPAGGPEMVCDGGPEFWGVVFNPRTSEFSDLEFNGFA
jgi:hypothetical protein